MIRWSIPSSYFLFNRGFYYFFI